MKMFIKNKFFTMSGNSTVKDENGRDLFKLKSSFFSIRRKKRIFDLDGNLKYYVKNKLLNFFTRSTYIYSADKQKLAKLKNRAFKSGYDVLGYGDEIKIDGWLYSGCTIYKNGEAIGKVSAKVISLADNYEVEVGDNEDAAFIVAMIIAMDNVRDRSRAYK